MAERSMARICIAAARRCFPRSEEITLIWRLYEGSPRIGPVPIRTMRACKPNALQRIEHQLVRCDRALLGCTATSTVIFANVVTVLPRRAQHPFASLVGTAFNTETKRRLQ